MKTLPSKLESIDPKVVLGRYIGDESTKEIAQSYGISRPALTNWLLKVAEKDWCDAQAVRAIERKERANDDMDEVAAKLRLGALPNEVPALMALVKTAETQLRAAQWDLERTYRKVYGDTAESGERAPILIHVGAGFLTVSSENKTVTIDGHALRA